ncbi:MAG TPA: transmembrane anchor protein [Thiomonas arsenitoxydans]|uniref:transmembrane anchor protein n=1 Tax=Thiomonas arsenitoxydans (strain DSM 22701 / CIP 110005 / 3As) TaxID=426114 RepID=UPI002B80E5E4|nr:transmembrane anchor protein [Thiomonas arsenitoxydans]HML83481.1 transmembrane anchor protein [Thiomonas arsenitoxydans]
MYNTDLPKRADLPTTGKLLRSTALAALIAGGLLVTTVLPAEYGIDPTGIGRALGLTPMGEIKMSLAAEARAGEQAAMPKPVAPPVDIAPAASAAVPPVSAPAPTVAAAPTPAPVTSERAVGRQDTMTVTLKPGQGAEVKLTMNKDSLVRYQWTSAGGGVNFDTHGDPFDAPKNFYHGYGKGRNQPGDKGELVAAFDGKHGWFWRNRTGSNVTVTLKTEGDYAKIERVL